MLITDQPNTFSFLFFSFNAIKIATIGEMYFPHWDMEGNIKKLYVNKSKLY